MTDIATTENQVLHTCLLEILPSYQTKQKETVVGLLILFLKYANIRSPSWWIIFSPTVWVCVAMPKEIFVVRLTFPAHEVIGHWYR